MAPGARICEIEKSPQQARLARLFRGNSAVLKRLASAGIHATKIGLYKNQIAGIWECETDKGKRWVSHDDEEGWKILKAPPGATT